MKRTGLKVYLKKTKVNVNGSKGAVLMGKIDPCAKRVKPNAVVCTKCNK